MPKRFTDTDKWKKPFLRGLQGPYKLLWFYILDDCDHAGVWQVDFEVAAIRIGEHVTEQEAIKLFGDRVDVFDGGSKWFLKDFISFQYGELSEKNRLHQSVINILKKNKVGPYKALGRGQGQYQGKGQGEIQGQGIKMAPSKLEVFEEMFADERFITDLSLAHKGKDFQEAWEQCWLHHSQKPSPPLEVWEWKQKFNTWLSNAKSNGKRKNFNDSKVTIDKIIEDRNGLG